MELGESLMEADEVKLAAVTFGFRLSGSFLESFKSENVACSSYPGFSQIQQLVSDDV